MQIFIKIRQEIAFPRRFASNKTAGDRIFTFVTSFPVWCHGDDLSLFTISKCMLFLLFFFSRRFSNKNENPIDWTEGTFIYMFNRKKKKKSNFRETKET